MHAKVYLRAAVRFQLIHLFKDQFYILRPHNDECRFSIVPDSQKIHVFQPLIQPAEAVPAPLAFSRPEVRRIDAVRLLFLSRLPVCALGAPPLATTLPLPAVRPERHRVIVQVLSKVAAHLVQFGGVDRPVIPVDGVCIYP